MPKQSCGVRLRFKQLRRMRGTQEQVGRDNGVTGTTIRYIENGQIVPSGKLMLRLAKYFGEPVEELFPDVSSSS
ncbi:helix-turn-helix transcriptional regulator [Paenibacillus naphthalenovorans]|uniref:helix-turn-helix transcriptional regulator n=1 Tax=Paenibacillus naphthalenovorans TaxID=162209 RepID=UPI0008899F18|nr:helix-turn-helix domain-containing protein [Paenibacillus naphthalenovorans]SDJ59243.1 putative transcriptional regulator [Paenibacillus naphthalenovorans]